MDITTIVGAYGWTLLVFVNGVDSKNNQMMRVPDSYRNMQECREAGRILVENVEFFNLDGDEKSPRYGNTIGFSCFPEGPLGQ